MPLLAIGGTTVDVADDEVERTETEVGEVRRAFSGSPRSSVRAHKAGWKVSTVYITRAAANTLLGLLKATPPLTITGDLTGSISGYALNIQTESKTMAGGAEKVRVTFEIWAA